MSSPEQHGASVPGSIIDKEQKKFKLTPSDEYAVRVCADSDTPIPVYDTGGASLGLPKYFDFEGLTDNTATKTLITTTVAVGKILNLAALHVSTRSSGKIEVTADGDVIATRRTAPGKPNIDFVWTLDRPMSAGVVINVDFTQFRPSLDVDIEAFLSGSETNA
ncbi:MAG: hypothetical protein V3S69_01660 [Dehalococcoidales bacterium]